MVSCFLLIACPLSSTFLLTRRHGQGSTTCLLTLQIPDTLWSSRYMERCPLTSQNRRSSKYMVPSYFSYTAEEYNMVPTSLTLQKRSSQYMRRMFRLERWYLLGSSPNRNSLTPFKPDKTWHFKGTACCLPQLSIS
jgi:hypothetical protein